jgi:SAM-dependent MidA family methyltransferase
VTPLGERIARQIAASGPLTIAQFMALALLDPSEGYYRQAEAIGRSGDFVTAPEVSQVFGELLGVWCIEQWRRLGQPRSLKLVELGPGRGTLAADVLRAMNLRRELLQGLDVHLVEVNETLRQQQRRAVGNYPVTWHETLEDVPAGPFVLLANEFFDALPIRQFERAPAGWRERLVGLDQAGALAFTLSGPVPEQLIPEDRRGAAVGSVVEFASGGMALALRLAERVAAGPGAALIVDYGYVAPPLKGTLQAVRRHEKVDPLSEPGATDLSAQVDFAALSFAARRAGAAVLRPVAQRDFLHRLGLRERFAALRKANPRRSEEFAAAERRLTSPEEMGTLFKAMAILPPPKPAQRPQVPSRRRGPSLDCAPPCAPQSPWPSFPASVTASSPAKAASAKAAMPR